MTSQGPRPKTATRNAQRGAGGKLTRVLIRPSGFHPTTAPEQKSIPSTPFANVRWLQDDYIVSDAELNQNCERVLDQEAVST
jgi:hypothetical protein